MSDRQDFNYVDFEHGETVSPVPTPEKAMGYGFALAFVAVLLIVATVAAIKYGHIASVLIGVAS